MKIFPVLLILVIIYLAAIFIYASLNESKGIGIGQATKSVNKAIGNCLSYLLELIRPEEKSYKYDTFLIQKLLKEIEKHSFLEAEYTYHMPYKYSGVPAIAIEFIPKNVDSFSIVENVAGNIFREHMAEIGWQNYLMHVIIKENDIGRYFIFVLYAFTTNEKKAFCNLSESQKKYHYEQAMKKANPLTDEKLERDLANEKSDKDE